MEQREGVWGCLECNWESKYKSRVFDHVEAKHIETGGYSCTICGKFCPSYSSLKMHKSRYHRELKLTWNLIKLILIDYFIFKDYEFASINSLVLSKMTKVGSFRKCSDCSMETKYKTRLFEHVEAKHVETSGYECPTCNKFLPSLKSLKQHNFISHRNCLK